MMEVASGEEEDRPTKKVPSIFVHTFEPLQTPEQLYANGEKTQVISQEFF
jgi:hypothetical protein